MEDAKGSPDINASIDYINAVSWRHSQPGLGRITELCRRLGNPQAKLRFVHVAGTNGKGSVAAMLAAVLYRAGYTTGLFTSPYIQRFNERMQVNGTEIADDELEAATDEVRRHADAMEDHPTEFEMVTAIAFVWYVRRGCDIVVCEVGLGGRMDATNVIDAPLLAVITAIGLDHTRELGDTLPQIATEKAGIIKPGGDVLLYPQAPEAEEVVAAACRERGAHLVRLDLATLRVERDTLDGQVFDYGRHKALEIRLLGAHQQKNAAMVVTAASLLQVKGFNITEEALRQGLAETRWPARFELLQREPAVVVDGGHNPQGVEILLGALTEYFGPKRVLFVCGVMADKDYRTMFRLVHPRGKAFYCVTPDNPRALPAEELAALIRQQPAQGERPAVVVCDSVRCGIEEALKAAAPGDVICAFGSFYMAGGIRAYFGLGPAPGTRMY